MLSLCPSSDDITAELLYMHMKDEGFTVAIRWTSSDVPLIVEECYL